MRRIGQVRFGEIEGRSRWFRIFRRQSARWTECVKDAWKEGQPALQVAVIGSERWLLKQRSKELYRERYGNPMIWMFLLEIVIKAIIWWLQNRDSE